MVYVLSTKTKSENYLFSCNGISDGAFQPPEATEYGRVYQTKRGERMLNLHVFSSKGICLWNIYKEEPKSRPNKFLKTKSDLLY